MKNISKKIIAAMLLGALCLSFAACQKDEEEKSDDNKITQVQSTAAETAKAPVKAKEQKVSLPFMLKFGMTYDEVKNKHPDFPELQDASANDGYFCGIDYSDADVVVTFLGLDDKFTSCNPGFSYSFNEQKELYELYAFLTIDSEGDAEDAFNTVGRYYSEKLGIDASLNETDTSLSASWKTKDMGVTLKLQQNSNNGFTLYFVMHNFEYELTD